MDYKEIVNKLIGPINPVGESHIDKERLENLKQMCSLVQDLVLEINDIARENRGRHEHSIHEAGEYAFKALNLMVTIYLLNPTN